MHLGTLEKIKSLNVTNLGVVLKRFGLVLLSYIKFKTEQQNQSRSLQYSKGSGTAVVGTGGDQKVFAERS